ncbi:autotransporter domain-containing protein [Luteibacter sp.]|uniref:autotransporter domain-containing protein n=1 Tax=Luteibacter sp. TaxID=1886636 RepID=UPI0025BC723B|nr:autotransporter domain-containing protein [Luteibacter sp.]
MARWLMLVLLLWLAGAGSAWAACTSPQTAHIAPGGTATFTCSAFGFTVVSGPQFGSVSTAGTPDDAFALTYTNTGITQTDSFTANDDSNTLIQFNITIGPVLTVTPSTLPAMAYGQAITAVQMQTTGGTAPYHYTFTGTPPTGLSISDGGIISGTPSKAGSFSFSVHVIDAGNNAVDKAYTVAVAFPTVSLTPATLPAATQGRPYSVTLIGSGGTPSYAYSLASGPLPVGISFNPATGVLSGTPTGAAQNYPVSFTVTDSTPSVDGSHATATQGYTLQVVAPPTIAVNPPTLPNATHGTAYSQTLSASGGTAPYTFSATALPAGLVLDPNAGTLSGTPTSGGPATFTATATDANGFTGSRFYSMNIDAVVPGAPSVGSVTSAAGGPSTLASADVNFTAPTDNGGSTITGYTVTSSPGGLTASGSGSPITVNGLQRGTAYTFTVVATNGVGTGAASSPSGSITPQISQTIVFTNPGTQNYGTTPTLTASVDTNRPLTFSSTTTDICTINPSTGQLAFVSGGNCSITVTQAGDATYLPASKTVQFVVNSVAPGAPTVGLVVAPDSPAGQNTGSAQVPFSPPANTGGSQITGYTVTASPGNITASGATSPITVTGLTLGQAYTFSIVATNGSGPGSSSGQSNAVTPVGAQTIAFNNPGNVNFGATVTMSATATSGLPVQFATTTPNVCEVRNSNQVFGKAPGNCAMQASQDGTPAYRAAANVTQNFQIIVPGGAVTIDTTSLPSPTRGTQYAQNIVASNGAPPYTFTVVSGSLPGNLTLNPSDGGVTGLVTQSGTFNFRVRVTDQAQQFAEQNYSVSVVSPTLVFTPSSLPNGKAAVPYQTTTVSASGGIAPYTYAITSGNLPAGLVMTQAGTISGTPTAAGSFNLTITATDNFGYTGSQSYTVTMAEPTPIAVDDTATVGANNPVTIPVTSNDSGPITSIAVTQAPAHGAAVVNGVNVVYTPAQNYFGTDTFKYTATGPGGTSNAANVNVTVAAGPVPTVTAQKATVLGGQSVTIHGAAGAGNGPFTAASVVAQPSTGNVQVQGTDLVYTAPAEASGDITFDYTLSNVFGTSQPAHVTVTVNPAPIAPPVAAEAIAGRVVQVNLTSAAHGGPFTGANVVSVSPSNAGATSIQASANGYVLTFTAAPTFGGTAQIGYTLTNAYATSAPGYITVTVTPRSDPSKDPEVLGVLSAQADATRRMAVGQISNFQRRLEMLHSGGASGFTNGITLASAGMSRGGDAYADLRRTQDENSRRYLVQPNGDSPESLTAASSQHGNLPGDVSVWTGGAINFGKSQVGTSDNGTDFTTSGLSFGVDKQFSEKLAVGAGVGYGHDNTDVGNKGSRSAVDSYNVALYASYRPTTSFYTDALIGYQWLSFDSKRYVTDNGNRVNGSRDGTQWFASISAGYQMVGDNSQFTPYGRLDVARARLDGYTEHGDDVYSLKYQGQTVKTTTATVGVLAQWAVKRDYGVWAPQLRAEFGHDMQGSGQAVMRYADLLDGPLYRATLYRQSRNHTLLGAGIVLQTRGGWMIRAEYQNQLDNTTRDNQSILLGIEKKFGP